MKFVKSNYIYLIWFILYFSILWVFLGANSTSFAYSFVVYAISISIALSPAGEWILRVFEGARELRTNEEKQYLLPIFEEVYQNALEENPKLSKNIKLFIIDANFVNAFAMGRNTIAVTTGAMQTFSPDELKGILAHEFGHISYGHTKALLLSVVGNAIFSILVLIVRVFVWVCSLLSAIFAHTSIVVLIINVLSILFKMLLEVSIFVFLYAGQVILSLNSRMNEFEADSFANKVSYGQELLSSLYLLQKLSGSQKMTVREKMTASHPHIAARIERLEGFQEQEILV